MSKNSSLNILFIGNSFTARNDLPSLVAKLALPGGCIIDHELISAGGASLRRHWNKGDAQRAIARGIGRGVARKQFDYVVLQEQSTLPIKNAERMHESMRLFDQAIRDNGVKGGAKTCLYMTWARAHAPESQRAITDGYTSIAKELGATLVPVGTVWEKFLAKHKSPVLHDADGSHPTLAGSYLAACVFVATLCGPRALTRAAPVDGIAESDATLVRDFVRRTLVAHAK